MVDKVTFRTDRHTLLQIEPTESEGLVEIDRFCDAMITIKQEADEIAAGRQPRDNNVIKNAPHTIAVIASDEWDRPYSRQQAVYPDKRLRRNKFWPASGRVDEVYGERNVSVLDLAVLQATFLMPCFLAYMRMWLGRRVYRFIGTVQSVQAKAAIHSFGHLLATALLRFLEPPRLSRTSVLLQFDSKSFNSSL